ncbi:MAG: HD domain-containing protein [Spirochaetia bacterium]
MGEREKVLDHLHNDYTEPVRDPVWKHIRISRPLLRVAEHAQFQKLDRIRQLGPAYLVYPGATHTRRSHSLGVFHVARLMMTSLSRRGTDAPITLAGVKSFLCACLLHDIGHYPFAHSLKDLAVEAHEEIAAREITGALSAVIRTELGVDPAFVAAIISRGASPPGMPDVDFYQRILSGVLDPDKLDYLNRDAYFCGVPYGIQDVDFILEEIFPDKNTGVAISPKGITALEDILFSKYLMYKTVYWHKTVRIATAMIKKAVAMGLADGAITRSDLYGLDDEEFFAHFSSSRYPAFGLIERVRRRELHRQVWRVPFREQEASHQRIEDIGQRLLAEERIAREVGAIAGKRVPAEDIVLDVPERVSFDFDVPVVEPGSGRTLDAHGAQARSSVFSGMGGDDLPRSIRYISVSARRDEALMAALERLDIGGIIAQ